MARRPIVDVDEEHLKEIMAGGVHRPKRNEQPKPATEQPPESSGTQQAVSEEKQTAIPAATPEPPVKEEKETPLQVEAKEPGKPVRKKREAQDYETLFLERRASVARRQTYINAELYEKINSFLTVIAGHQFTITSYINNIMTHHLELYKDDINELYERKSKKPF
jgi:type IV secretory pathway VirB10-like protein